MQRTCHHCSEGPHGAAFILKVVATVTMLSGKYPRSSLTSTWALLEDISKLSWDPGFPMLPAKGSPVICDDPMPWDLSCRNKVTQKPSQMSGWTHFGLFILLELSHFSQVLTWKGKMHSFPLSEQAQHLVIHVLLFNHFKPPHQCTPGRGEKKFYSHWAWGSRLVTSGQMRPGGWGQHYTLGCYRPLRDHCNGSNSILMAYIHWLQWVTHASVC